MSTTISCKIEGCDWSGHHIVDHLADEHDLEPDEYEGPLSSQKLKDSFARVSEKMRRQGAPSFDNLETRFSGFNFPVNWDVPAEACLPMPKNWKFPEHGRLARDVHEAAISLRRGRSIYIWGMPGSGKDALFHAYSNLTRTPGAIFTVRAGVDVEEWMYVRSFDQHGTKWEEGKLLRILRDGYTTKTGRKVPYIVLITDFDRATPDQSDVLRLCLDSIKKRVMGPQGKMYDILPGTMIVATANTAGSGDERGRFVSAKPVDASIMDRFERGYEFHWMDWRDEEVICRNKFPFLNSRYPVIFKDVGEAVKILREAIEKNTLYTEFSHRAVCAWLGHAEDILYSEAPLPTDDLPKKLLIRSARCWLDLMPDREQNLTARRLLNGKFTGFLEEGDTSHIQDETYT